MPARRETVPDLAPIAEAAAYYQVTPRTVRRYISTGLITGYRVGPKLLRVDMAELGAAIHRVPTVGSGAA